jgi:hypothetical protein
MRYLERKRDMVFASECAGCLPRHASGGETTGMITGAIIAEIADLRHRRVEPGAHGTAWAGAVDASTAVEVASGVSTGFRGKIAATIAAESNRRISRRWPC